MDDNTLDKLRYARDILSGIIDGMESGDDLYCPTCFYTGDYGTFDAREYANEGKTKCPQCNDEWSPGQEIEAVAILEQIQHQDFNRWESIKDKRDWLRATRFKCQL